MFDGGVGWRGSPGRAGLDPVLTADLTDWLAGCWPAVGAGLGVKVASSTETAFFCLWETQEQRANKMTDQKGGILQTTEKV
jgi:hypothetical protein